MVYDYLAGGRKGGKPWALTLAERCYDMQAGKLLRLPTNAAAIDQNEQVLTCLYVAWRTWFIAIFKPANKMRLTHEDDEFMRWVHRG